MGKNPQKVLWLVIVSQIFLVNCEYFSVVGPKTLRIDEPYEVAVTSHSLSESNKTISVGIEGVSFEGEVFEVFQDILLVPGEISTAELILLNLCPGNYYLKASTDEFSKSASLFFNSQKVSLLIQINKPFFRPNDLVEFRVFALNSKTKPYEVQSSSSIRILDAGNQEVKVWDFPLFKKGLIENTLQLNEGEPGTWRILVEADGEFASKSFEVRKDKRPIFELVLSTPSQSVSYRDGSIKIKVKVKVVVKSSIIGSSGFTGTLNVICDEDGVVKFHRSSRIKDEIVLDIDFKNDLQLEELSHGSSFNLIADYVDDLTNKTFSAKTSFDVEMSDYFISIDHAPKFFKPEIPYSFSLLVTKVDGYPVLDSDLPLKVVVTDDDDFVLHDRNHTLDPNTSGVLIALEEISVTAKTLYIKAFYDRVQYAHEVHKTPNNDRAYLSINVLTPRPSLYENVEFSVISSENVPSVVFLLFSKGLLKISRKINLSDGKGFFTETPKFSFAPKSHCIVYYIDDEGNVISDSITLQLESDLPNFVNLTIESSDVNAGDDFILSVSSTLNSTVSLLAVDQRSLSQNSDHDITKDFVFDWELSKYDSFPLDFDHDIPFWFYHKSYQKKFVDVGAVILTNAVQDIPCESSESTGSVELTSTESHSLATHSTSSPVSLPPINPDRNFNQKFYETFLFKTIDVTTEVDGFEGRELLHATAPDLPSSWIITGISLSNQFGLGLTTYPALLNTLRYFYIDFITPKFIKLGEIVVLEILIVNLFDSSFKAEVKFANEKQEFEFVRPFAYNWTAIADGQSQKIWIQANSIYRLRIEIEATKTGFIDLIVSTTSVKAGDTIERQLLVVPEGFPSFENHAEVILVDECDKNGKEFTLSLSVPSDVRSETIQVSASVTGDVLGPALIHLDSLIRLPSGCGEQTMITFVPIVLALEYLTVTEKLTQDFNDVALEYLELGYQRVLNYRHSDGSFSAFGNSNSSGSTWLTAFAAKYLRRAQKFIEIDDSVISLAYDFVLSKQNVSGEFREDGIIFLENIQSGTGSGIAFTAYVTAAVQDDLDYSPQYIENVQRGVSYVKENFDQDDVYSLAIVTWLLVQANEDCADHIERLLSKAIRTPDYVYWKYHPETSETDSLDIEISSYALLMINQIPELYQDGFKIFRWLISQQNSHGGFQSTQDTVVGLEAISNFAEKMTSTKTDVEVELNPEYGLQFRTTIDNKTNLVTQAFQLESNVRKLHVKVRGKGYAIVQLSCNYYINHTEPSPSFDLSVSFNNESCENRLVMNISTSFKAGTADNASNIVVLQVDFPSGFAFDPDTPLIPEIQKVEERARGSAVNIYFNSISVNTTSFTLVALRNIVVYRASTSNIKIFDFYDTSRRASIFYKIPRNLPSCNLETETDPCVDGFSTTETLPTTKATIPPSSFDPSWDSFDSDSEHSLESESESEESESELPIESESEEFESEPSNESESESEQSESELSNESSESEESESSNESESVSEESESEPSNESESEESESELSNESESESEQSESELSNESSESEESESSNESESEESESELSNESESESEQSESELSNESSESEESESSNESESESEPSNESESESEESESELSNESESEESESELSNESESESEESESEPSNESESEESESELSNESESEESESELSNESDSESEESESEPSNESESESELSNESESESEESESEPSNESESEESESELSNESESESEESESELSNESESEESESELSNESESEESESEPSNESESEESESELSNESESESEESESEPSNESESELSIESSPTESESSLSEESSTEQSEGSSPSEAPSSVSSSSESSGSEESESELSIESESESEESEPSNESESEESESEPSNESESEESESELSNESESEESESELSNESESESEESESEPSNESESEESESELSNESESEESESEPSNESESEESESELSNESESESEESESEPSNESESEESESELSNESESESEESESEPSNESESELSIESSPTESESSLSEESSTEQSEGSSPSEAPSSVSSSSESFGSEESESELSIESESESEESEPSNESESESEDSESELSIESKSESEESESEPSNESESELSIESSPTESESSLSEESSTEQSEGNSPSEAPSSVSSSSESFGSEESESELSIESSSESEESESELSIESESEFSIDSESEESESDQSSESSPTESESEESESDQSSESSPTESESEQEQSVSEESESEQSIESSSESSIDESSPSKEEHTSPSQVQSSSDASLYPSSKSDRYAIPTHKPATTKKPNPYNTPKPNPYYTYGRKSKKRHRPIKKRQF